MPSIYAVNGAINSASGIIAIIAALFSIYCIWKTLFYASRRSRREISRYLVLALLALIAALALLYLADATAKLEKNQPQIQIAGDTKSVALQEYLLDRLVPVLDCWWWEIKPADRLTAETRALLWSYKNIFNERLNQKCQSREEWPKYYEKIVVPCLWQDVCIRKAGQIIAGDVSVKANGPEKVVEKYLVNQPIYIKDAWWWQIPGENRATAELQDKFWRLREVFNAHSAEKCETQEQWAKYYQEIVAPCLWSKVYVSRMYTYEPLDPSRHATAT